MDEVLKSLKMQIKKTRGKITIENSMLQDIDSVDFRRVTMNHLAEYNAKLAQLEDTYSMLMHAKKQK